MIYDQEEEPRVMPMTDQERERAREIIAAQASTTPEKNAAGIIDLSPEGSLRRADGVCGVDGRRLGEKLGERPLGFPRLTSPETAQRRWGR